MRRVSPVLLVLVLLIGLLIPAAAARGTRREPHSDRVSRTRAYWTSERMKAARPMPIPTGRLGGDRENWESARERPGYVPSVAPRTLSATSTTSTTSTAAEEVPLAEQQSRPLSTNGKVFLTDPVSGANYVCSGTALNAVNLSVVWTAGHCTYDGGYFTNWVFVPAYRDGSAPFGVWPAIELRAPLQWRATYNLRYDFGAAVVSVASDGSRLAQAVGGRGFLWNAPREQTFDAYGYPVAPPFSGGRMHGCHSDHAGSDAPPGLGPETMAIWCDMTGGSSGGGWIVGDALNSNISYGRTGAPGKLFGPYLGETAAALYHESSESTAPGPFVSSPTPSPTPSATETEPTPSPSSTPVPTPEPVPSSSPSPSPAPSPSPTPVASPSASPSPEPTPEPTPEPIPEPTAEPPVAEPPPPVILNVRAGPDPFSPDGDGRKDVARIRFRLTKLATVRVVVKRYGVRVALPLEGEIRGTGRNVVRWDGRNTKGRRVRSGRYVFVIKATPLRADRERARGNIRVRYR